MHSAELHRRDRLLESNMALFTPDDNCNSTKPVTIDKRMLNDDDQLNDHSVRDSFCTLHINWSHQGGEAVVSEKLNPMSKPQTVYHEDQHLQSS